MLRKRAFPPRPPMGRERILQQNPHDRPKTFTPSPAPLVHAATKKARLELMAAYRLFVAQFVAAAARLRNGDLEAKFPQGSFPPGLPFVMPRLHFDPG